MRFGFISLSQRNQSKAESLLNVPLTHSRAQVFRRPDLLEELPLSRPPKGHREGALAVLLITDYCLLITSYHPPPVTSHQTTSHL